MRIHFVLCVAILLIAGATSAQSIERNYPPGTMLNFFEIEFDAPIEAKNQNEMAKEYRQLEHVTGVSWLTPTSVCLITEKAFSIKSIKPSIEKYHLSIVKLNEEMRSHTSSCLKEVQD